MVALRMAMPLYRAGDFGENHKILRFLSRIPQDIV
jgi:hypothetical protein